MDPNTAMEAVTEGAKAITKFQEILQKVFNPKWTRAQTDADMDANERKLQMIRNNPDMEIVFIGNEMHVRKSNPEELAARANQRMLTDAVRQEANIEKVIEVTAQELSSANTVSDEPVDDDWITRFFSIAKDVSNEEMQYVWGKILAGEIATPKSFSLKTLDTLRNISATEAKMFQKIIPLILYQGGSYFVSSENEILLKYGSSFSDILSLDECGLVNSSGTLSLNLYVTQNEPEFILNDEMLIVLTGYKDDSVKVRIGIHTLTKAGRELYSILAHSSNEEYVKEVAQHIFEENRKTVKSSVHKLLSLTRTATGNEITYTETSIASYGEESSAR